MKKLFIFMFVFSMPSAFGLPTLTVGSKPFTESFVLAEIISQIIEETGEAQVDRKFGLGDTAIVFEGVRNKKIDFYVEYTGTLSNELLKSPQTKTIAGIREKLKPKKLTISDSLGFNNTYAITVNSKTSEKYNLSSIQDLAAHPHLIAGFTNSFIERLDGYPMLREEYGLDFTDVRGISHGLKTQALKSNKIDVTDFYATDAKLSRFDFKVLEDTRSAFPTYYGVILTREDVAKKFPKIWESLRQLEGQISREEMAELNALVEIEGQSFAQAAGVYLKKKSSGSAMWENIWHWTLEHFALVFISLGFGILVGVPLAIVARFVRPLGQTILASTGIIQTIPSLALLCFLIPLFGIGTVPAIVAMSLYALLPIVAGTYVGLTSIDPHHLEVAKSLGLTPPQQLLRVELPLASRQILSGIKTAGIINVGTATLAALIGAGGYGQPIVTGLGTYNMSLILQGAIPSGAFALLLHAFFEVLSKLLVPRSLQTNISR